MKATGFVIHHSACGCVNGKGYDYFVTRGGLIVPGAEPAGDDGRLHICLEGDFSGRDGAGEAETEEQLFLAAKLIARLSAAESIPADNLFPHNEQCPGSRFPWTKLVISISSGYH